MSSSHGRCGVCSQELSPNLPKCSRCDTPCHPVCFNYNGDKCPVYACGGDKLVGVPVPPTASSTRRTSSFNPAIRESFFHAEGLKQLGLFMMVLVLISAGTWVSQLQIFFGQKVLPGQFVVSKDENGKPNVYDEGQHYYPSYGATAYNKHGEYRFSGLEANFADGLRAKISGTLYYELPSEPEAILYLNEFYSCPGKMDSALIRDSLETAVKTAARGVFYTANYSGPPSRQLEGYVADQLENGNYSVSPDGYGFLEDMSFRRIRKKPSLLRAFGFKIKRVEITEIACQR